MSELEQNQEQQWHPQTEHLLYVKNAKNFTCTIFSSSQVCEVGTLIIHFSEEYRKAKRLSNMPKDKLLVEQGYESRKSGSRGHTQNAWS